MLETAQPAYFKTMPRVTVTVPEKNPQPYRFQLDRQSVSFGRGDENDIEIDSGSISANHAEMRRIQGGYELVDLDSTTGIMLAGVKFPVIPLHHGADVKLGDVKFDFLLAEDEMAALAAERPQTGKQSPLEFPPPPEKSGSSTKADRVHKPSGLTLGGILLFLILAVCAFFAGLAIRHQQETGKSLIEAIQEKFQTNETLPITPVPEPKP